MSRLRVKQLSSCTVIHELVDAGPLERQIESRPVWHAVAVEVEGQRIDRAQWPAYSLASSAHPHAELVHAAIRAALALERPAIDEEINAAAGGTEMEN